MICCLNDKLSLKIQEEEDVKLMGMGVWKLPEVSDSSQKTKSSQKREVGSSSFPESCHGYLHR